jgi:hypothetical protein
MAHCNPSTWKAEAGESRVGLHSETVFQKQTNKQNKKSKEKRRLFLDEFHFYQCFNPDKQVPEVELT